MSEKKKWLKKVEEILRYEGVEYTEGRNDEKIKYTVIPEAKEVCFFFGAWRSKSCNFARNAVGSQLNSFLNHRLEFV